MLTAFEICKAAYPGIPDAILNEYAELLPAEAAYITKDFQTANNVFWLAYHKLINAQNAAFTKVYNDGAAAGKSIPGATHRELFFIKPANNQHRKTVQFSDAMENAIEVWVYQPAPITYEYYWRHSEPIVVNVVYDSRIYANPQFVVNSRSGPIPGILLSMSTDRRQIKYVGRSSATAKITLDKLPYAGLSSLIAMYENGVTLPDINYEKAYSFLTYVNAYKKFSTQIDAEKSLLTNQAAASLAAYQQDFKDRADREKTELQSKKLQIFIAIDNEAKSAQRDFQNMLINAQNLRNTLGGSLG